MAALVILGSLLRDRASLFQSFVQPIVLSWILASSLGPSFAVGASADGSLRAFLLSFSASEFYAVVILLLTVMVASQYGTDMAVQCVGPTAALGRPAQYGSDVRGGLSVITGTVLLVLASVLVFLIASWLVLGVLWPWVSPAFWLLLGGLVFFSVCGGFALGLLAKNQGLSDLLISVLVVAGALAAGAFFPYPETSRVWSLAPYNPFTRVLVRLLSLLRTPISAPGALESGVWMSVLLLGGVSVQQLRRGAADRHPGLQRNETGWVVRHRAAIVSGLALVLLPVAIWLTGPAEFSPSHLSASTGLMYPYAGLATVLILLVQMLLVAPAVDGPVVLRNMLSFRRRFLLLRAGIGTGFVLASGLTALLVWRTPSATLLYTALALTLFQVWSLGLMFLLAELSRDKTVYWAVALSATLLITFLGGSFWQPTLFGAFGGAMSYLLPNGLLVYHAPVPAVALVLVQIVLLFSAASPSIRQRLLPLRRGAGGNTYARAADRLTRPPDPRVLDPLRDRSPSQDPSRSATELPNERMLESMMLRERKRILDEVHDTLGHGITGALWQIRSAKGMTEDPSLLETLDRAVEGLEQGLFRIREYLRDSAPRRLSDWSELYSIIGRFSHCPVDLAINGDAARFHPTAVKLFVQAIRELLTNALRYGTPTLIHVSLVRTERFHRLEYREHGRGWGEEGPRMGYGLSTVHTSFTEIGGSFHLDRLPETPGIQVIAIIPSQEVYARESP